MREEQKMTIAVAASFPAEPICEPLLYWMRQLGIPCEIECASYGQVSQQLIDHSSVLSRNQNGVNVLLVSPDDWAAHPEDPRTRLASSPTEDSRVGARVEQFIETLKSAVVRSPVPYLIFLYPILDAIRSDSGASSGCQRIEDAMASELQGIPALHIVTASDLAAAYPVSLCHNPITDEPGYVPFTQEFYTAAATMIARKVFLLHSRPYKVIVLDCDQTLWKGICGEGDPQDVEIDAPHQILQEFMVARHDEGMLLCLCSKNNCADVEAVFDAHPEMPLGRSHIVSRRINWQAKSRNIRALADKLKLGLDSFIFLDDDPVECAEVRTACPEVLTLQLPRNPDNIPRFLEHVWVFDHIDATKEDRNRTRLYKQDLRRSQSRERALTLRDFLESLELNVRISPLLDHQVARVAQLTQRTNQFNVTNIRRCEQEVRALCTTGKSQCLVVQASDRFGDYGLVGVVIFNISSHALAVDTFLLSCRALGRGIEHRMLARLGDIATERNLTSIEINYSATRRNQPALCFLRTVTGQFELTGGQYSTFNIPADLAASLIYDPDTQDEYVPDNTDNKDNTSPPNRTTQPLSAVIQRIATELYDVEHILADIESNRLSSQRELPARDYVAPRTFIEKQLCEIWQHVLAIEQIGVCDNFFELGGHSLLAMRLMSRIHDAFGARLSMRVFFDCPTVEGTAKAIGSKVLEDADGHDISALLDEMGGLSDSEVETLLAEERRLL